MAETESLGLRAVALLASKFGKESAANPTSVRSGALVGLRELLVKKFGHDGKMPAVLAELKPDTGSDIRYAAAGMIDAATRTDYAFAAELRELVGRAREDRRAETIVAVASDHARQVIVGGDVDGDITL